MRLFFSLLWFMIVNVWLILVLTFLKTLGVSPLLLLLITLLPSSLPIGFVVVAIKEQFKEK